MVISNTELFSVQTDISTRIILTGYLLFDALCDKIVPRNRST